MTEFIHTGREKKQFVQNMFDDISGRYDFLNHLLSFGIDYYWRFRLLRSLPDTLAQPVLDVATGTGDVGFLLQNKYPGTMIVGLDYSFQMTRQCLKKITGRQAPSFHVIQGDGEKLPFPDQTFSAITIAFGFRNIGHYDSALAEFHRVLIPGGTLHILEFAQPRPSLWGRLYTWYFTTVLPKIGAFFSRADAYRYLPESVAAFPSRDALSSLLMEQGFHAVKIQNLTFGTVTLITAAV
ncbi:MAG: ubiquinone/menaquinone biosynthesis methyltransferase [Fidelibacterota bacterium]